MQTILISSQKGGSGKTTLAAHIAVAAGRAGREAYLIDTDKQGTLARWHERRAAEDPALVDLPIAQIAAGLPAIEDLGADLCVIDSAPTISAENRSLIEIADLIVIPVKPSPADLWAVGATVDLAAAADRPILFVISQANARASITGQAIEALAERGRVAETLIGSRVAFAAAMIDGRTVQEIEPRSRSAAEISALWQEIETTLKGARA